MSTYTGTATDYLDLLTKLDSHLRTTGHAWGQAFTGTGTGRLTNCAGTAASVAETITVAFSSATAFTVSGSVSGALGSGTVGTPFTSAKVSFTAVAGSAPFTAGDTITLGTSPAWTRLRAEGCGGANRRTGTLLNIENLFDGNVNTTATAPAGTAYVDFEMLVPTEVREIIVQNASTGAQPTAFRLQYADASGGPWTTAQSWSGQTWGASSESKTLAVTASGVHAFWRFEITASSTASIALNALTLHAKAGDGYDVGEHATMLWQAPGLDGARQILIGARTYGSTSADTFNIGFAGLRVHSSALAIDAQPNGSTARWLSLINAPITYWLVVSGQRFVLVTRAAGVYQTAYCGFGLPYEPPSVHAYPMIVGASSAGRTTRYSTQSGAYRHPMDPGDGLAAYYPDATWRNQINRITGGGSSPDYTFASGDPGKVWPSSLRTDADHVPSALRDGVDSSRPLLPGVLLHTASPTHAWGEFDGYYWVSGFGASAEAIVTEGRHDHLVVPNIYRTSPQHYAAVRLD